MCSINLICGVIATCVAAGVIIIIAVNSPRNAGSLSFREGSSGLLSFPRPVDLGTLRPGEAGRSFVAVTNVGGAGVTIAGVESSCPCVRFAPIPVHVQAGGRLQLIVIFDPREEPEFRGNLSVEVVGREADGRELFRGLVNVAVVGADTNTFSADAAN